MSKSVLVDHVAEEVGLKKEEAKQAVDACFEGLASVLAEEGRFAVHGFGTFNVKDRAARNGRNPATGESIRIPASKVIKFKPSPNLKDQVS